MIIEKRRIKKYFLEALGSSHSKKENVRYLLDKYKIDPSASYFFGDAETDYLAAKAYNIHFIGILPNDEAPLIRKYPEIQWYENFCDLSLQI